MPSFAKLNNFRQLAIVKGMVVSNVAHADESQTEKGQIAEADYMQKLSAESAEYQAMPPKLAKYGRLQRFMEALKKDIYPEPLAEPHNSITRKMVSKLLARDEVKPRDKVLDIGCGQGLALELFKEAGLDPTGITLGEDYRACKTKGLNVYEMDQSFLEFEDREFDIVWCRHSIEHSIFPLFTLSEFHRVLKEAGLLYIEVPAPETSCHHERNQNHYSVLGKSMWVSLFSKSNFKNVYLFDINFQVPAGPDMYWSFLLRRGS